MNSHLLAVALLSAVLFGGEALANRLTLHGQLLKPDRTPVVAASTQFVVRIFSPGSERCLLYQESFTKNLSTTMGTFSVTLGDGSRPATNVDGGFSLQNAFLNRGLRDLSSAPGACLVGTSYTPSVSDDRLVTIQFNDGTGWQSIPTQKVTSTPRSLDSERVGGYDTAQILRLADGVSTTGSELNSASWTELLALINGTSTQYARSNQLMGRTLPAAPAAGQDGQSIRWNNTSSEWEYFTAAGGGSVSSVSLTMPSMFSVAGSPITSSGTLAVTMASQSANRVLASPDGVAGAPSFRALVEADIPNLAATKITSGTLADGRLSSNVVLKDAANTFSVGNHQINASSATEKPLILRGAAAQSVNFLEILNSSNVVQYSTHSSGTPTASTDLTTKAYVDSAISAAAPALGGDVTGSAGSNTVGRIQGRTVHTTAPNDGQVYKWNHTNTRWEPASDNDTASNATSANTPSTVVQRGTAGEFAMGDLTVGAVAASGAIRGTSQISTQTFSSGSNAINWNNGNIQSTSASCTPLDFTNMQDGGSYTLIVTNTATTACTWPASINGGTAVTWRGTPNLTTQGTRTASSHTVYTMLRAGSIIYVSWITGFQ